MIIACDVDDVLVDFYSPLAAFHNGRYGTNLSKSDFFSYLVHEVWGGTREEAVQKMRIFYGSDSFRSLPLVEGAARSVRQLVSVHDLAAVTGRPHYTSETTEEMLNRHFNDCFVGIHHTDAFSIGAGVSRSKAEVCAEIGATVIIEDYLGHAIDCANNGMRVILFDQPWNRGQVISGGLIERVHSWDEVLEKLL